jgi:hypothetical protein
VFKQQLDHGGVHSEYTQQELYLMGRITPYQPMGRQDHVSQDRMREILSKNCPQAAQSGEARNPAPAVWPTETKHGNGPSQPPRPVGKLIWADREPGSMGRYTACHWYSCCQIGKSPNETFEVWTRNPLTGGMTQLVVGLKSFKEGIAAAQADADMHYARGDR